MFLSIVLPLHLELLLGGAKHLNFIFPPRPNPSVYLIPYFQSPFTCPLIRGVIWGFGTATACITSGVVPPSCYTINNACTCRLCGERQPTKSHLLSCRTSTLARHSLCGERQPTKSHLLSCRTSTLARHIVITPVNVNKVVNVLYVI